LGDEVVLGLEQVDLAAAGELRVFAGDLPGSATELTSGGVDDEDLAGGSHHEPG
jgi:hypothetical protein